MRARRPPVRDVQPLLPQLADLQASPAALEHQGEGGIVIHPHVFQGVHEKADTHAAKVCLSRRAGSEGVEWGMTAAEREVLEANAAFYAAFEQRDPEAMDALWAREAPVACLHPGWEPLFGREAVVGSWRRILLEAARRRRSVASGLRPRGRRDGLGGVHRGRTRRRAGGDQPLRPREGRLAHVCTTTPRHFRRPPAGQRDSGTSPGRQRR